MFKQSDMPSFLFLCPVNLTFFIQHYSTNIFLPDSFESCIFHRSFLWVESCVIPTHSFVIADRRKEFDRRNAVHPWRQSEQVGSCFFIHFKNSIFHVKKSLITYVFLQKLLVTRTSTTNCQPCSNHPLLFEPFL